MIKFSIPMRLPSRNVTDRQHWAVRRKEREKLAWLVAWALPAHLRPARPIEHAKLTVRRHGTRALDYGNLVGSAKGLEDILQPTSKRHPYGLGIIRNDSPRHLELVAEHVQSSLNQTDVIIEDLDNP